LESIELLKLSLFSERLGMIEVTSWIRKGPDYKFIRVGGFMVLSDLISNNNIWVHNEKAG